ncbi:methionine ABC transporter permease [Melissococcus plutonius]|uniref:Methionine ABC transporter permease protein n=1 Tax=Melissococcus plutonius TaxID=33970 RepID=A0A2Z5Y1F3_9ENTE|nr:methionine ABC transporter permease [Melissococcus plutonius]BAL61777.1 methionine ABC transporter permease [Melissococcus plutonius DAT561]MCV2498276.1 ABC transporter permease [Melissococcus plutonius]MCV2501610.1 ABC transporter permease [Melissococcus plutonius]MCV2504613.1 ABC transporter permease [Melissococcus plutonius]MCV2506891.1 ABC transporter permease [Melissococcus plutonius]
MNEGISSFFDFSQIDLAKLQEKTIETLTMTGISIVIVTILGLLLGLLLFETSEKSNNSLTKILYWIVAIFVNIFRSIPFIILIVLLIPFTKNLLGSMSGVTGALPALIISAAPFYARMVEIAFHEIDRGVIEAAEAMGASRLQIIWKVLLPESLPALISGLTVTTISLVGYTAMAAAIGAGGLGSLAYQDGFQRGQNTVTLVATVCILIIVFIIQFIGDVAVKKVDKR